jgi:hypothetical protein
VDGRRCPAPQALPQQYESINARTVNKFTAKSVIRYFAGHPELSTERILFRRRDAEKIHNIFGISMS